MMMTAEQTITWVDEIPRRKAGPGRTSRWYEVVTTLSENPGKAALVHMANTVEDAEVTRGTLLAHARNRNIRLRAYVRGTDVYAVAKKKEEE